MDAPQVEIKRRRPSTHRRANWLKAGVKDRQIAAAKAGLIEPVKCAKCEAWREGTDYRTRLVSGKPIRYRICKRCDEVLAKRAQASSEVAQTQ